MTRYVIKRLKSPRVLVVDAAYYKTDQRMIHFFRTAEVHPFKSINLDIVEFIEEAP